MSKMTAMSIAALAALLTPGQAPASRKPCRDKAGRIIVCPKPAPKASPRCKDAQGRFVSYAQSRKDDPAVR